MKRLIKNIWFRRIAILFILVLSISFWFCLPEPLFNDPTSTVIEDRNRQLLGAKIADDGQWRFPNTNLVPEKFVSCITTFEDQYFFDHPGVNLFSLIRATLQNLRAGRVVGGGSTISMQVIRLSRRGESRTIVEKLIEITLALRLEIRYSKSEIMALYASHAPFGGNVVGLDAASWRYFERTPGNLSWSESALLAVLPNAPALIYPGRNQDRLLKKRNMLLSKMFALGLIDSIDLELALDEKLPLKPKPLGQYAPHLLSRVYNLNKGTRIITTLDFELQKEVSAIVEKHHQQLVHNEIYNAAALIVSVETGEIKAYIGNTNSLDTEHACDVDMIIARRSTGSILKPILFASMLDDGLILPNTLIPDIPTQIGGFSPVNFDKTYSGAVPAQKALYRSLNVPAVKMLQEYGVSRFSEKLKQVGMTSLTKSSDHYGLSLILGGAETSMLDLASIYSSFSRVLNHFYSNGGKYNPADYHPPYFELEEELNRDKPYLVNESTLSAASLWFTYEAMRKVNRPYELSGWNSFSSSEKIAWKTGTSFGFRDAWAVGVTPEYVVVVWVGNADGEGRPGLTGVSVAAPIMFDIFNLLPQSAWFDPPYDEMRKTLICRTSGHRANRYCKPVDTVFIPATGLNTKSCPYHQLVHLDQSRKYRVTDFCYEPDAMVHESWFVLPPVMEWYYKRKNPIYQSLPAFSPECPGYDVVPMEFVYPRKNSRIYIPLNLNGDPESVVLEVAHREENASIFWYLDEEYLGQTSFQHQMNIRPTSGAHTIIVIDSFGNQLIRKIEIISKRLNSD